MRPRAYVETTIPSSYFGTRPEPELLARRDWTRAWWAQAVTPLELLAVDCET